MIKKIKSNRMRGIFIFLFTILVFYFLIKSISISTLLETFKHSNIKLLIVLFLLLIPHIIFTVLRWQEILKSLNYSLPFKKGLTLTMGSFPIVVITPSKLGNRIKAFCLRRELPLIKGIGSVWVEHVVDLVFLALLSLIGLLFHFEKTIFIIILSILIIILVLIGYSNFLHSKVKNTFTKKITYILLIFRHICSKPKILKNVILYSILIWAFTITQFYYFFVFLNIQIPLFEVIVLMPIAIIIGMIPITIGGVGTRDTAIISLFSQYSGRSELFAVGMVFTFFRYVIPSIAGSFFIKKMFEINKKSIHNQ